MREFTWNDIHARWRDAMIAGGVDPDHLVTEIRAVAEHAGDLHVNARERAGWWLRTTLPRYPAVNWDISIGGLVTGGGGYAVSRTSRDFPYVASGAKETAQLLARHHDDPEAMAATLILASDAGRDWSYDKPYHMEDIVSEARRRLGKTADWLGSNGNQDSFLPVRTDLGDGFLWQEVVDALAAEHLANLAEWTPVRFTTWLLVEDGYRLVDEDEISRGWAERMNEIHGARTARRAGKVPTPPVPAPAGTTIEHALAAAVAEYYETNGIRPIPVQFGMRAPDGFGAVAANVEGEGRDRRVALIRSLGFGEKPQRGHRYSMHHHSQERIGAEDGAATGTIRALVHQCMALLVPDIHRLLALRDAGSEGEDWPLWAHEVHPMVAALHPDLGKLIDLDPDKIKRQMSSRNVDKYGRAQGWAETHGSAIRMRHVEIAKGVTIDEMSSGTYLHVARMSVARAEEMIGQPVGDLLGLPAVPQTVTLRTAARTNWGLRLKIEDGAVAAAPLPEGIRDWRVPATRPPGWEAVRKRAGFGKPAAPVKKPIRHADTGMAWHG
jgi:hypothetical protein